MNMQAVVSLLGPTSAQSLEGTVSNGVHLESHQNLHEGSCMRKLGGRWADEASAPGLLQMIGLAPNRTLEHAHEHSAQEQR